MSAAIEQIESWLESKGTTLWADWDISRADRRRLAAEWFYNEMANFVTSPLASKVRDQVEVGADLVEEPTENPEPEPAPERPKQKLEEVTYWRVGHDDDAVTLYASHYESLEASVTPSTVNIVYTTKTGATLVMSYPRAKYCIEWVMA